MGSRRAARELALQYLFGHEFQNKMTPAEWLSQYTENYYAENYSGEFQVDAEVAQFSKNLCEGVLKHKAEIDPVIQGHSSHWKLSRMSLVDINILRVAVYEMHFSSTPLAPKIVINEAIDIAKLYGTIDSGAFVNGIIDQIAKSMGSVG